MDIKARMSFFYFVLPTSKFYRNSLNVSRNTDAVLSKGRVKWKSEKKVKYKVYLVLCELLGSYRLFWTRKFLYFFLNSLVFLLRYLILQNLWIFARYFLENRKIFWRTKLYFRIKCFLYVKKHIKKLLSDNIWTVVIFNISKNCFFNNHK